ncbi:hypothetical protein [Herpetosiphon giganteus]|uniref:hypothetical protein n=1 Tax=Herpetosiphon giganteus TaxID=2029754 RepID=UPI001958D0A9|nr:hypothetical protein [Herpetosiphon giganteus]MBM7844755.1 hypothetical protein [Herpetosiphon giganteus]
MHDLLEYQTQRDGLIAQLRTTLAADQRFVAGWLVGSFGRNAADAVSDLDLMVIVAEAASAQLCAKPAINRATTTPERAALFTTFGPIAALYEAHHNAPAGGTQSFVCYQGTGLIVDWTLVPADKALRPVDALILFEHEPIAVAAAPQAEPNPAELIKERVAFFWMMSAVTIKYLIRKDHGFVTTWLEELQRIVLEVERLIEQRPWSYQHGSRSQFAATTLAQKQAIQGLIAAMQHLTSPLAELRHAPLPELERLLALVEDN